MTGRAAAHRRSNEGRPPSGRRRLAVVGVVVAVLVAGTVGAVVWRRSDDGRGAGSAATSPVSSAGAPGSQAPVARTYTVKAGPPVPAEGAYFGAWVLPEPYSQPGRVASVERFEKSMGRELDIVHLYRTWTQSFGTDSDIAFAERGDYLLLSWAGTDTRRVVSGSEDDLIRQRAREVRSLPTKVFLEWRWEMDRANLASQIHSPEDFVAAWKHIRAIFAAEKVGNAGWVWCPTAGGFATGRAQKYYPGDDQVDWLCADVYPEKAYVRGSYEPFAALVQPFLDWAAERPKPVMIGEYGVPRTYGSRRAQWLTAAGKVATRNPQIKAMVYFEADPPDLPVEHSVAVKGDAPATAALAAMAADPYFKPARAGR